MRPLCLLILPALLALAPQAPGQPAPGEGPEYAIPDAEARDPPTPARLAEIERLAGLSGWFPLTYSVRAAAVHAYSLNRFAAADAWFHVYQWLELFSVPEDQFYANWRASMATARLDLPAGSAQYQPTSRPIGIKLSPELKTWLLSNREFSQEFFSIITGLDHLPNTFAILDGLYRRDPGKFARYSSLALAIAVVYDVQPPASWPHHQVTEAALPRKLANPAQTYEWLVTEDMAGRSYHRLTRLRADELKYVVDIAAPPSELNWSLQNVGVSLDDLEEAYKMVPYRNDRAADEALMTWTGQPYTLQAILKEGGICVDQAYFATEVGKARGVPTLLFSGFGQSAQHAWFGFLDSGGNWRLDAGRYAEARLVTGLAFDPQTWLAISDHDLEFLKERFRALPSFLESSVQVEFAREFLQEGKPGEGARAARAGVNYERRNVDAWETLIAANAELHMPAASQEAVFREAALAFTPRYPDLEIAYVNRVCSSLRARGESSLADFEERGLAERLQAGNRDDLATRQAGQILARSIATQSVADQIGTYNALLAQFGHGAGTIFFHQIVVGFAEHLAQLKMKPEARAAAERASEILEVESGTQLGLEMDLLQKKLED